METGTQRETGSVLYEIHQNLMMQGERFAKNIARIAGITNKLEDESANLKQKTPEAKIEEKSQVPGIVKDLSNDIDSFRGLNNQLEDLIDKLQRII